VKKGIAMRPLWSGSINFGLINIPVRLFSGSQSNTLDLDMAIALIDHLTTDFRPKVYRDTYIEDLKRIIEQKAKGLPVRAKGEQPMPTNVKDLMKLLRTSIESQKKKAA